MKRPLSNIRRFYLSRSLSLRWRLLPLLMGILAVTLLLIGTSVFRFISQNEQRAWRGRQTEAADHAAEVVAGSGVEA